MSKVDEIVATRDEPLALPGLLISLSTSWPVLWISSCAREPTVWSGYNLGIYK